MGWSGDYCPNYKERKKEVERHFTDGVLRRSWVGNTMYYAHRSRLDGKIYAGVVITRYEDGWIWSKEIHETMGPGPDDCPKTILAMLDPTDDEYAVDWRKRCEAKHHKPKIGKLPIGTKIRFTMNNYNKPPIGETSDGRPIYEQITYTLTKMAPSHQFKTPWWYNASNNTYFKKVNIPEDFEIIG